MTIFPLVDTEGDFEIKLYDKLLNVYNDSRKIHINKNKWTKVLKQKCGRGYLHDNRLYQFDKGSITVYDCNSGKKLKSYSWTGMISDTSASMTTISTIVIMTIIQDSMS